MRTLGAPQDDTLDSLVSKGRLQVIEIPTLGELLNPAAGPCPWTTEYRQDLEDTFVVLHTSGSTGNPKVVNITHGLYATLDVHQRLATNGQRLNVLEWADRELFTTLPPFHAAGLNLFGWSVFQGTTLVLGPADRPPSVSTVERALDLGLGDVCVTNPSILEDLVQDKCALSKISHWSSVSFGGGPLSRAAGNALWEKTRVHNLLGSTETNTLPEFVPTSKGEWPYHNYHPSLGIEFRHRHEDLRELVIVRHDRWREHQAIFWTFPELNEYPTKDLYEQHHSKPNLWAYRGRIDDIIVLSNGEKFNPTEAESMIANDPNVKSAMIVGNNHAQSALLVELFDPSTKKDRLEEWRESIINRVQQANKTLPDHAQIHASHIRILPSSYQFLRSAKGELRRAPTVELLKSEIADLYECADATTTNGYGSALDNLDFTDTSTLTTSLSSLLSDDVYLGKRIDLIANIFQCGFDSLKVMKLLRNIKTSMASQDVRPTLPLTPKTIYQNPSPMELANALLRLSDRSSEDDRQATKDDSMNQLLSLYSKKIGSWVQPSKRRHTVLLTGSTGSFGSYILDRLIENERVESIICLNRVGGHASRQAGVHEARGLMTDFSKVRFLETDLSKDQLGLDEVSYWDLALRSTLIVHNAWPVDFNLSLSSFEPQLAGCLHLLKLASEAPHLENLSFMSSVGVASGWSKRRPGQVPEAKIEDLGLAEGMGYSQSKLLSELLLAYGCDTLDVPVTVCRIGQIAGPVLSPKGMWSPKEWFPSIMLSCEYLGKVPADLGALDRIDWIPVDVLADALTEALLSSSSSAGAKKTAYMHFVNPKTTSWTDLVHTVSSRMSSDQTLEIVPFSDWLDSLASASETSAEVDVIPAIKLLDFLREVAHSTVKSPSFSTRNTQAMSPTLNKLSPVTVQWVEQWHKQWSGSLE